MSDAKGNQEPSMEEILASIRRIISEDGEPKEEPEAGAVNGHAPAQAATEDDDDDALVLTDMVVGESNVVELKEEPAPTPAPPPAPAPPAPTISVKHEPPAAVAPPAPEPAAPEPEPVPEPVAMEPEALPEIELEEDPVEPEPYVSPDDGIPVEPVQTEPPAPMADTPMDSDLISPDVAAASAATMAQLMARKPQPAQTRPSPFDGLLVETLVRQAIEPMLKDWLDEHLQEIVERLVRREVERLSRKAELS